MASTNRAKNEAMAHKPVKGNICRELAVVFQKGMDTKVHWKVINNERYRYHFGRHV